jgi:hypothetical protein
VSPYRVKDDPLSLLNNLEPDSDVAQGTRNFFQKVDNCDGDFAHLLEVDPILFNLEWVRISEMAKYPSVRDALAIDSLLDNLDNPAYAARMRIDGEFVVGNRNCS